MEEIMMMRNRNMKSKTTDRKVGKAFYVKCEARNIFKSSRYIEYRQCPEGGHRRSQCKKRRREKNVSIDRSHLS